MSISRRKILKLFPIITAAFVPVIKAEVNTNHLSRHVLGYQLHDDHSVSLLSNYARSLALKDERVRGEAQKMFHKAEQLILDRQQVTGYGARLHWNAYLEAHENDTESTPKNRRGG